MRKLRLDLDGLQVESFSVGPDPRAVPGTVRGADARNQDPLVTYFDLGCEGGGGTDNLLVCDGGGATLQATACFATNCVYTCAQYTCYHTCAGPTVCQNTCNQYTCYLTCQAAQCTVIA